MNASYPRLAKSIAPTAVSCRRPSGFTHPPLICKRLSGYLHLTSNGQLRARQISTASNNAKITCQCGTVSFHASHSKPLDIYVCHCIECRKQSASAFGVSAIFPAEGMWPLPASVARHVGVWTRQTDSGNTLECYFCKCCGVRILHRAILPDGKPKPTLSVKAGCLERFSLEEAKHIFTRTALVPVPEGSDLGAPKVKPGMKTD